MSAGDWIGLATVLAGVAIVFAANWWVRRCGGLEDEETPEDRELPQASSYFAAARYPFESIEEYMAWHDEPVVTAVDRVRPMHAAAWDQALRLAARVSGKTAMTDPVVVWGASAPRTADEYRNATKRLTEAGLLPPAPFDFGRHPDPNPLDPMVASILNAMAVPETRFPNRSEYEGNWNDPEPANPGFAAGTHDIAAYRAVMDRDIADLVAMSRLPDWFDPLTTPWRARFILGMDQEPPVPEPTPIYDAMLREGWRELHV